MSDILLYVRTREMKARRNQGRTDTKAAMMVVMENAGATNDVERIAAVKACPAWRLPTDNVIRQCAGAMRKIDKEGGSLQETRQLVRDQYRAFDRA